MLQEYQFHDEQEKEIFTTTGRIKWFLVMC